MARFGGLRGRGPEAKCFDDESLCYGGITHCLEVREMKSSRATVQGFCVDVRTADVSMLPDARSWQLQSKTMLWLAC